MSTQLILMPEELSKLVNERINILKKTNTHLSHLPPGSSLADALLARHAIFPPRYHICMQRAFCDYPKISFV